MVAALVAAALYGWWLVGLEPFAWSSTIAVSVPALAVIAAVVHRQAPPAPVRDWWPGAAPTSRWSRPAAWWAVLLLAFAGVQLFAYFAGSGGSRSDYPTLSWIVGHVESRPGRTALFVAWCAFGASLVRR